MNLLRRIAQVLGGMALLFSGAILTVKLILAKIAHLTIGATIIETLGRVAIFQYLIIGPTGLPDDAITVGPLIMYLGWETYVTLAIFSFLLMLSGVIILIHVFGWDKFKTKIMRVIPWV